MIFNFLDGLRSKTYVVRRNPVRANEIATNRTEKYQRLEKLITKRNDCLEKHSKAKQATAESH